MTEKQLLKFIQENKFDAQSARASFLACDHWFPNYANAHFFKHNLPLVFGYIETFNSRGAFYQIIQEKDLQAFSRDVYLEYLKAPKKLIKKIANRDALSRQINVLWEEYRRSKPSSRKASVIFLEKFFKQMDKWVVYAMIGEDKWKIVEDELAPDLAAKNNLRETEIRNKLAILSHPKKTGIFTLERKLFLKICYFVLRQNNLKEAVMGKNFSSALKNTQLNKRLEAYRRKFFWIKTDFYNLTEITPEVLLADVRKEIATKNIGQVKKELQKIDSNIAALQQEKKRIRAELKMDKKNKQALKLLAAAVVWHDKRKEEMMRHFYYLFSTIESLAAAAGLSYDYLSSFSAEEFRAFLKRDFRPAKKPQAVFAMYARGKKPKYFYGAMANKLLQVALKVGTKKQELAGTVASRGQANCFQGRARIIVDPRHDKFKKGEILVTSMTRVEFVPLMRKAKAVITDEGGLACHAAIISRELNLPCIISTKNATKFLKNGDWVEMDMGKGTIKIIS